jgi:hypothetical protein
VRQTSSALITDTDPTTLEPIKSAGELVADPGWPEGGDVSNGGSFC